MRNAIFAVVS